MKILFIITQSEIGGAQRYLLELTKYLSGKGHEVAIAAGEGDKALFAECRMQNAEWVYVPNLVRALNPVKDLFALLALLRIIKRERPDILFLQSTKAGFLGSLSDKIACYMLHATCPKIIYRIGGWSFRDPRSWWMNKILLQMEKVSAPWKDIIIVNSEFDKKIAIAKKIAPENKIIKIYNGVDPERLDFFSRDKAREMITTPPSPPLVKGGNALVIGTIANLYATKGLEYFIKAANILSSSVPYYILHTTYYIVIGEGKERPKLESLIKKHNLENNFFLVGHKQNAYKYLRAFDIFVLPSIKEGMPWAILEAMAAGVPVIATRTGAIPEIIEDEKDGLLVTAANSAMIAEKIAKLIENPALSAELAKNASKKLEKFSLSKMLKKSEKLITP